MSVSYRGRSEGVLLYENEWMDSVEFTPQKPTYRTYGREVVLVDQQLSFLDRNDIDKADTTENRPIWGAGCLEGYPRLKSYIDRINDSILVMATISPCVNNYDNETDPSGIMRQPSYKTVVSTDLGATWKENLGIWNPRDSNGSDFGRMKIVDDTTWIDHQGNFYEGIRTAPRKVECPLIKRSDRYWAVSDALDRKHLMLTSWSILDSVRKDTTIIVHNEHEMSLVTLPACTLDPLPVLKRQETFYDGYRGIAGPWKLVLMKNGEAIIARCAGSESLKTRKRRFEWSLYILTKSTSSAETLKISSVNAHEIRDGIVFFSKACIDAGTLEYYSLYGAVAATVAFEAGSRQSNIPSLSPGVYFVHLRNEVPLKFVVQ